MRTRSPGRGEIRPREHLTILNHSGGAMEIGVHLPFVRVDFRCGACVPLGISGGNWRGGDVAVRGELLGWIRLRRESSRLLG